MVLLQVLGPVMSGSVSNQERAWSKLQEWGKEHRT